MGTSLWLAGDAGMSSVHARCHEVFVLSEQKRELKLIVIKLVLSTAKEKKKNGRNGKGERIAELQARVEQKK